MSGNPFATLQVLVGKLVEALNGVVTAINSATPVPPTSGTPGAYIRINLTGTGYEPRTPVEVLADIVGAAGAVGTYALASYSGTGAVAFGATVSGTLLQPSNSNGSATGTALTGTWQLMGTIPASGSGAGDVSLWLRTA